VGVRVDTAYLRSCAGNLDAVGDRLPDAQETLARVVRCLKDSATVPQRSGIGDAADAFGIWVADLAALAGTLRGFKGALTSCADGWDGFDQGMATEISKALGPTP
jgi:hypothetical protein